MSHAVRGDQGEIMTQDKGGRHPRGFFDRRTVTRGLAALPLALAACAGGTTDVALPDRPAHHTAGGFRNPPGSPTYGGSLGDWVGFFYRSFTRNPEVAVPPGHVLPETEALAGLERLGDRDGLTWLGHASFLLRLGGRTDLTDPYLSSRASPLPFYGPKRFAGPGLRPAKVPPVDLLLISHNHYDHLDLPTLDALAGKGRTTVVVPLGLRGYVEERGFGHVHEVDWHDRVEAGGLTVTALPAIHFSKRTLFDRNATLWTGYAIEGGGRRVWFAGDTAYGPVFAELGRRYAPFDLALVPIGAYEPRELMRASHATPEEAVRLGRELGAGRLVGMHWGTIQLTDEPPFEPPERFRAAARAAGYAADDVWVLGIGETRGL